MENFYSASVDEQIDRLKSLAVSALRHWDVSECEPELLKYRENAVFRVVAPNGSPAALRVHRHGYHSDDELHSELKWMAALRAAGIDAPGVIPSRSQSQFVTASAPGVPEPRQVDMMEWLSGEAFGSLEAGLNSAVMDVEQAFTWVGQLAARLHRHSVSWSQPNGFVRHAWDMEGLLGDSPLWGRFWELETLAPPEKALIDKARARARDDLMAYGQPREQFSLIHADLLIDNIILGENGVKVIDFDDCGYGWHLFDLATIGLFLRNEPEFDRIWGSIINGYRSVCSLPDEQLALMPLFYLLRSFTYLGWIHTRFETPAAKELAPMLTGVACGVAEEYLRR